MIYVGIKFTYNIYDVVTNVNTFLEKNIKNTTNLLILLVNIYYKYTYD